MFHAARKWHVNHDYKYAAPHTEVAYPVRSIRLILDYSREKKIPRHRREPTTSILSPSMLQETNQLSDFEECVRSILSPYEYGFWGETWTLRAISACNEARALDASSRNAAICNLLMFGAIPLLAIAISLARSRARAKPRPGHVSIISWRRRGAGRTKAPRAPKKRNT